MKTNAIKTTEIKHTRARKDQIFINNNDDKIGYVMKLSHSHTLFREKKTQKFNVHYGQLISKSLQKRSIVTFILQMTLQLIDLYGIVEQSIFLSLSKYNFHWKIEKGGRPLTCNNGHVSQ